MYINIVIAESSKSLYCLYQVILPTYVFTINPQNIVWILLDYANILQLLFVEFGIILVDLDR